MTQAEFVNAWAQNLSNHWSMTNPCSEVPLSTIQVCRLTAREDRRAILRAIAKQFEKCRK